MPSCIEPNPTKIAYLRVSTDLQGDSRAGLEAQRTAIMAEIDRRGWSADHVAFVEDASSRAGRMVQGVSGSVAIGPSLEPTSAFRCDCFELHLAVGQEALPSGNRSARSATS